MGFSFRKGFKLGKGARINLSKKGLGLSFGTKGFRVGVGSGRRARVSGGVGPFRFFKSLGSAERAQSQSQSERSEDESGGSCGCLSLLVLGVLIVGVWAAVRDTSSDSTTTGRTPITGTPGPAIPAPQPISLPPSNKQSSVTAQQRAIALYPELGVANSRFNREFLVRYRKYQQDNRHYFDDPEWPSKLAKETKDGIEQR
jgi:hypothetical protein